MSECTPLKLRAEDAEDLTVIAACLQDSLACLGEMAYDQEARRFALILVRFTWEAASDSSVGGPGAPLAQVKAGLHFDTVSAVRTHGIDRRAPRHLLSLITITSDESREPKRVKLLFVGGEICLDVDRLLCRLQDLEAPRRLAVSSKGSMRQIG